MGVAYESGYRIGEMTYAYVYQTDVSFHVRGRFNGIPVETLPNRQSGHKIDNAVANIAWRGDLVVAFGHSFVKKSMSSYCGIYLPYIKHQTYCRICGSYISKN